MNSGQLGLEASMLTILLCCPQVFLFSFTFSGTTIYSVEILHEGSQSWQKGPEAPEVSYDTTSMVEHPNGGVVYMANNHLYLLPHAGAQWLSYHQAISPARYWFTALFIPDDITTCS